MRWMLDNRPKRLLKPDFEQVFEFQWPSGSWAAHKALVSTAKARRWLRLACNGPAQITVRIVGAAEGRALNKQYRGKDYATNVLTFNYALKPVIHADLVLCAPVIAQEARAQNKPLLAHYAHMMVHGALHAQGYDHETNAADAHEMEALEGLLMAALGFENPY
jgi:probable rRNA maturation factor